MAETITAELLAHSLAQTLEEAAFVFAEPAEDPPPFEGDVIEARLAYTGPDGDRGELVLAASVDFAATLAANLLGEDEGGADLVGDDQDAMGELLNMLVGSFVVTLYGADVTPRLGLPAVSTIDSDAHAETLRGAVAVATLVDEEGRRIDLAGRVLEG